MRALRRFLERSQSSFAEELGVRQQTVSEWETGVYRPRGASATLLSIVAHDAGFPFDEYRDESNAPANEGRRPPASRKRPDETRRARRAVPRAGLLSGGGDRPCLPGRPSPPAPPRPQRRDITARQQDIMPSFPGTGLPLSGRPEAPI